jgi:hypothetical protein
MSILLFSILFTFNFLCALGAKVFFDDSALVKNKPFRLFLLIPPVAIVCMVSILLYGVLYTLYLLFADYLR